MVIVDELNKIIQKVSARGGSQEDLAQETTKFICSLDYQDENIKEQSDNFVKKYVNDYIVGNKDIPYFLAKTTHCMLTKSVLADRFLDDININYSFRPKNNFSTAAFYRDSDRSVNFFNEEVASQTYILNKRSSEKGIVGRLDSFSQQLFELEHEIQHSQQYKNVRQSVLTPRSFLIERQLLAVAIADSNKTKYSGEKIYSLTNHHQFYFEADAIAVGTNRALALLDKLSPDLKISDAQRKYFQNKIDKANAVLSNSPELGISHKSNPNNDLVNVNHKCNIILDELLPLCTPEYREQLFKQNSSLKYTYNPDGSKKTLEQVEKEKNKELERIKKGPAVKIESETNKINKLYETIIESDPTLSFEHCLQHIARLNSDSDRYFTDGGTEVVYKTEELMKELRTTGAKANMLATYLERAEVKDIKKIMSKYKKEIDRSSKKDPIARSLTDTKRHLIYDLEHTFNKNAEITETYRKEMQKAAKNRIEKEKASEIIKKVFPGFNPQPQIGTGSTLEKIELSDNYDEKMLLASSLENYRKQIMKQGISPSQDKDFVPIGVVDQAIKTLYPFEISQEKQQEFEDKFNNGELSVVKNKYTPEPVTASENSQNTPSTPQPTNTKTVEQNQHTNENNGMEM